MKGLKFAILSIILIALRPLASLAFDISLTSDYERKGFFIGVGAGLGRTTANAEDSGITDGAGFVTDFKLGYGTSGKFAFIGTFKGAWYMNGDGLSILSGIPAFGFISWFAPDDRSVFLTGGVGIPVLVPYGRYLYYGFYGNESTNYEPYVGAGFFAGAGLELSKRFSMEADIHAGVLHWLGDESVPVLGILTLYFTFNIIFYWVWLKDWKTSPIVVQILFNNDF